MRWAVFHLRRCTGFRGAKLFLTPWYVLTFDNTSVQLRAFSSVAWLTDYISYQWIYCHSSTTLATNASGLFQTERKLALAAALPLYEVIV